MQDIAIQLSPPVDCSKFPNFFPSAHAIFEIESGLDEKDL
jgi:hypothetical protein